MLGASPFVLASYPGVPAHTVQDVIKLAKSAPGKHTFAEAGPATLANLAGVLFNKMAGVQITAASYRGTEQEVPGSDRRPRGYGLRDHPADTGAHSTEQGSCDCGDRSTAQPGTAGCADGRRGRPVRLRSRALASAQRARGHAGADPGSAQYGDQCAAARDEDNSRLAKVGVDADPSTPQQLADRIAADIKKWHDVIISAGIKVQ